jgi:hypothetical protein
VLGCSMTRPRVIKKNFTYPCAGYAPCGEAGIVCGSSTAPLPIARKHLSVAHQSWAWPDAGCLWPVQRSIPWIIFGAIAREIEEPIALTTLWMNALRTCTRTSATSGRQGGCAKPGCVLSDSG